MAKIVLLLAFSISLIFGQAESGTVVGAVSDQAGAAVAGANAARILQMSLKLYF